MSRTKLELNEKELYNWEEFVKFADKEGISLEFEEDWGAWWVCWKAGIDSTFHKE